MRDSTLVLYCEYCDATGCDACHRGRPRCDDCKHRLAVTLDAGVPVCDWCADLRRSERELAAA